MKKALTWEYLKLFTIVFLYSSAVGFGPLAFVPVLSHYHVDFHRRQQVLIKGLCPAPPQLTGITPKIL